jgi:hypothetical protein
MIPVDAAARTRSRFHSTVVIHWLLLPWSVLVWWGIALLAANVSNKAARQDSLDWPQVATMIVVFSLGLGLWICFLRAFRRWWREAATHLLPNWCYPLLWAFASWLLMTAGFYLRSWQYS